MKIDSKLWWILAGSMFAAWVLIAVVSFVVIRKMKKTRIHYQKASFATETRPNEPGTLLWDLKRKLRDDSNDHEIEMLINTIFRNNYKTFYILDYPNNYLKTTFEKLALIKENIDRFDFLIVYEEKRILDNFYYYYEKLNSKGMIIILETNKKNYKSISFLGELQLDNLTFEVTKQKNGIIFIVKNQNLINVKEG